MAEKQESESSMAVSLLETVSMTDRVLTGDALYCQRQLCEQVVDEGGYYLLIVKNNQKGLYEDIELCFDRPAAGKTYASLMLRPRASMETDCNFAGCGLRTSAEDIPGLDDSRPDTGR